MTAPIKELTGDRGRDAAARNRRTRGVQIVRKDRKQSFNEMTNPNLSFVPHA